MESCILLRIRLANAQNCVYIVETKIQSFFPVKVFHTEE